MPETQPPVDENVIVPASVRQAAEAAVAAHKAAYGGGDAPAAQLEGVPPPVSEPVAQPESVPPPVLEPQTIAPQPTHPPIPTLSKPDDRAGVDPSSWEGRYYAMEGRFRQSQISIGQMQQQMAELGDELARVTQAMNSRASVPEYQAPAPQAKFVTDDDVKTYGPELLETIKRAALDAVQPEIQQVANQNRQVSQRVAQTAQAAMYQQLDAQCPEWRSINTNPRFKTWCNSPDVYSGQLRGRLLNAAVQAANAPRAIAFFKGFQNEEVATGNAPAPQPEPQGVPPVPRQAAVALDTLTAPGRAKPATGDTAVTSAEKPFITRAQISQFYADVRRGVYAGRDADKKELERRLEAAQREGRIR
jgi:hypothetical protein